MCDVTDVTVDVTIGTADVIHETRFRLRLWRLCDVMDDVLARVTSHDVFVTSHDVIVTSDRSALESSCQILNFSNRTNIKGFRSQ